MTDLIKREDALAAIDMALNNATGDLFDCHAAIRALPAIDPAATREAALEAKLAKAVEMLILCGDMFDEVAHPSDPLSVMIKTTLAELKGQG